MKVLNVPLIAFAITFLGATSTLASLIDGYGATPFSIMGLSFDTVTGNASRTKLVALPIGSPSIESLALSPNGQSLYGISGRSVYRIATNDGTISLLGNINVGPISYSFEGADFLGNELLAITNGVRPQVWTIDMANPANSILRYEASSMLAGRPSAMANLDADTILFTTDYSGNPARLLWTMDADGTTIRLGQIIDAANGNPINYVRGIDIVDGKLYAFDAARGVFEVDYLHAAADTVYATKIGTFPADGSLGFISIDLRNEQTTPVPVPSTMLLFGSGLAGLIGIGRWRLKK